jgi:hypothetical protein
MYTKSPSWCRLQQKDNVVAPSFINQNIQKWMTKPDYY